MGQACGDALHSSLLVAPAADVVPKGHGEQSALSLPEE